MSKVTFTPNDPNLAFYSSVQNMTAQQRIDAGYRKWNDGDPILWLVPAAMYDSIPDGSLVVDIFYLPERFKHGVTDKDTRYGLLAFGVLCEREDEAAK